MLPSTESEQKELYTKLRQVLSEEAGVDLANSLAGSIGLRDVTGSAHVGVVGTFECVDCDGKVSFSCTGNCPHCGAPRVRSRTMEALRQVLETAGAELAPSIDEQVLALMPFASRVFRKTYRDRRLAKMIAQGKTRAEAARSVEMEARMVGGMIVFWIAVTLLAETLN